MCRNQCPDNSEITVRMFSKTVSVCVRNMQKKELNRIIDKNEDYISIIKLISQSSFEEEYLGKKGGQSESIFI